MKDNIKDIENIIVRDALLVAPEEKKLKEQIDQKVGEINDLIVRSKYKVALSVIASLTPDINDFLDNVRVMDDNLDLRNNRLALLQKVNVILNSVADLSALNLGGEKKYEKKI